MNIKRERPNVKKSRLENEVILAVVILYVLLSAALLAIHHIQPTETETRTSSTSPSHEALRGKPSDAKAQSGPTELSLVEVHALLARQGYQEIRGLRRDGLRYRATAIKGGKAWEVEVDPVSHGVVERMLEPPEPYSSESNRIEPKKQRRSP